MFFNDTLLDFALKQHVKTDTHKHGHTLDLIITRGDEFLTDIQVYDPLISDHQLVVSQLVFTKPTNLKKSVTFRKFKSIDMDAFSEDITNSELYKTNSTDIEELAILYYETIESIINKHAPEKTKTITQKTVPWFNSEISEARRVRRRVERKWRNTKNHSDLLQYKKAKNKVASIITVAKSK